MVAKGLQFIQADAASRVGSIQALCPMISIVPSTRPLLSEVLGWLEREHEETGEGFHCNRDIIVSSHQTGELLCAISDQGALAFAVYNLKSVGSAIDILEVHPMHRKKGIGTLLASAAVGRLFEAGSPFVTVQCSPRSSEKFWRSLGFEYEPDESTSSREPVRLIRRNLPNGER